MTDQDAPCSPNKLQPLMASKAALDIPMELQIKNHKTIKQSNPVAVLSSVILTVPSMNFGGTVIVFCTSLPYPKIRSSVSSLHVINQILYKGNLILSVYDLEPRRDHLD